MLLFQLKLYYSIHPDHRPLQMSDSRVSSVIQEWASAYPSQAHSLNAVTSSQAGSTGQLTQMDMIPYSQSQGMMRGGADDRVAEQMMGLSYLPYSTSCVGNTSNAGSTNHHQSHGSTQQVTLLMCNNSSVANNAQSPLSSC